MLPRSTHAAHVALVVPAYNEEARLPQTLSSILRYFESRPYRWRLIVVDDGSRDRTVEVACSALTKHAECALVMGNTTNRGKGYTIRRGFLEAAAKYIAFSDADLSTPIDEIEKLLSALERGADVAIGSRAVSGARIEVRQPRRREVLGRLFNLVVRALLLPGISDTQCGFKAFTCAAATDICARMTADRFAFDVEMLYLARLLGYRIAEIPVRWRDSPGSRVRVLSDPVSMLTDVLRFRRNALTGRYDLRRPAAAA